MKKNKLTIQQKERVIIHPQIERWHQEEKEFGSFFYEHRIGLSIIVCGIFFTLYIITLLGLPR